MVDEKDVKIEFPCEYFIKVLMTADDDTRQLVVNTLDGHIESFDFEAHVTTKPSKKWNIRVDDRDVLGTQ
jgi:putative lipoic acid-binding regulatory protein